MFLLLLVCTEQILSGQEILCTCMLLIKAKLNLWGLVWFGLVFNVFFCFFPQKNSVTFKALILQLWYVLWCSSMKCLNASSACTSLNDGKLCLAVSCRLWVHIMICSPINSYQQWMYTHMLKRSKHPLITAAYSDSVMKPMGSRGVIFHWVYSVLWANVWNTFAPLLVSPVLRKHSVM